MTNKSHCHVQILICGQFGLPYGGWQARGVVQIQNRFDFRSGEEETPLSLTTISCDGLAACMIRSFNDDNNNDYKRHTKPSFTQNTGFKKWRFSESGAAEENSSLIKALLVPTDLVQCLLESSIVMCQRKCPFKPMNKRVQCTKHQTQSFTSHHPEVKHVLA